MSGPTPAAGAQPALAMCSPWATYADIDDYPYPIPQSLGAVTEDMWNGYLSFTSEILYRLTGGRWGGSCTEDVTLRSAPPGAGQKAWPYSTTWGSCSCWNYGSLMDNWLYPPTDLYVGTHLAPMAIRLPHEPVISVESVAVNGQSFTAWRFTRAGWLERTDNEPWVVCLDSTEISYTYGQLPPPGGKESSIRLAIEFAKMDAGLGCALPNRVTSMTREGVSLALIDPMEFLPLGQTGVYRVDLWIKSVNPYGNRQRARVLSPDIPSAFTTR